MATEPTDRYQTVRAFQQDLREYLKHRESLAISHRAAEALAEESAEEEMEMADGAETVYIRFSDIGSRFRQALDLWEENQQAAGGFRQATLSFARAALRQGDLRLARAQANQLSKHDQEATRLHREIDESVRHAGRRNRQARVLRAVMVVFVIVTLSIGAYGAFLVHWSREQAVEYSQEAGWESHDRLVQKIEELQQEIEELKR